MKLQSKSNCSELSVDFESKSDSAEQKRLLKNTRKKLHRKNNPEKYRELDRLKAERTVNQRAAYQKSVAKETRRKRKERIKNDPLFALRVRLSTMIWLAYKRNWRKKNIQRDILGCERDTFVNHMISTAISNYGFFDENETYQFDHIIPLATAKTCEDLLRLSHYSNLQFLKPEHNRSKSKKLNYEVPN